MTSTTTTRSEGFTSTSCVFMEEALRLCNKLAIVYELPVAKSAGTKDKKASAAAAAAAAAAATTATTAEIENAANDLHDVIRKIELDRAFLEPSWDNPKLVAHHKIVCDEIDDLIMESSVLQFMHPLLRSFFLIADAPSAGVTVEKRLSGEIQLVFTGEDEHLVSGPVDPEKICEMTDMDLQWFSDVMKGKKSRYSTANTTLAQALTFLTLVESWEANLDGNLKTLIDEREVAASRREARIAQERQEAERRQSEEALNAQADLVKTMEEARDIGETSGVSCRTASEDSCMETPDHPSSVACETTPELSSAASSIFPTTTSESECESVPTPEEADVFFDCEEEARPSKSLMRSFRTWLTETIA